MRCACNNLGQEMDCIFGRHTSCAESFGNSSVTEKLAGSSWFPRQKMIASLFEALSLAFLHPVQPPRILAWEDRPKYS